MARSTWQPIRIGGGAWVLVDTWGQRAIVESHEGAYRWRLSLSEPWHEEPTKIAAQRAVRTALKEAGSE